MTSAFPFCPGTGRFARRAAAALCLSLTVLSLTARLSAAQFVRGDGNRDGTIDLTDVVAALGHLFLGDAPLACADAADFNDSGRLDLTDAVQALEFLFRGGPPPAQPHPEAGFDQRPDLLGCGGEPDAGEEEAMALLPEDGPGLEAAQAPGNPPPAVETAGNPLAVDGSTFLALAALADGDPVPSAPGLDGREFLAAFHRGLPGAGGPVAVAVDAVLPAAGNCARVAPELIDGGSHVAPIPGGFVRGDVDGNGLVEEGDAFRLADCLDGAGPCPGTCWDAADANDDGMVESSDVEHLVLGVYGEVRLPAPGPRACGTDPTADDLPDCSWSGCPPEALTLAVEPEVICGAGPHRVTLIAVGNAGLQARAGAMVMLCEAGKDGCEGSPPRNGGGGDRPAADLICRWVTSESLEPPEAQSELNQKVFDAAGRLLEQRNRAPLASSGGMEVWRTDLGPGPDHALSAFRTGAGCRTPPTELSFSKSGRMQFRLNLVCVDGRGNLARSCDTEVEVEGTYAGQVEAGSEAGPGCSGPNRVQALAQEEGVLSVNSTTVFAKGVSVQNGNSVSSTPSWSAEVGISPGAQGLAANSSIRFGHSQTTAHNTGKSQDKVDAFGNTRTTAPVTISLEGKGRVDVQAHHRTWARASTRMLVAGYWLVARTSCPVSPFFGSSILGEGGARATAENMARQFRETRLGR